MEKQFANIHRPASCGCGPDTEIYLLGSGSGGLVMPFTSLQCSLVF